MTRREILRDILIMMALLMLLSSCTNDGRSVDGEILPEGKYPLVISSVSIEGESIERPWGAVSRVSEDTDGLTSKFEGGDSFCVQIGNGPDERIYVYDSLGISAEYPIYWKNTETATITAWYPISATVDLSDQSNGLAYVLKATEENVGYTDSINLGFEHQLAKVRVELNGSQADQVTDVELYSYTDCSIDMGIVASGSNQDWIKMKKQSFNDGTCWEANVVPGTIVPNNFIRLNDTVVDSILSVLSPLEAGKLYTISLTVGVLDDAVEIDDSTGGGV